MKSAVDDIADAGGTGSAGMEIETQIAVLLLQTVVSQSHGVGIVDEQERNAVFVFESFFHIDIQNAGGAERHAAVVEDTGRVDAYHADARESCHFEVEHIFDIADIQKLLDDFVLMGHAAFVIDAVDKTHGAEFHDDGNDEHARRIAELHPLCRQHLFFLDAVVFENTAVDEVEHFADVVGRKHRRRNVQDHLVLQYIPDLFIFIRDLRRQQDDIGFIAFHEQIVVGYGFEHHIQFQHFGGAVELLLEVGSGNGAGAAHQDPAAGCGFLFAHRIDHLLEQLLGMGQILQFEVQIEHGFGRALVYDIHFDNDERFDIIKGCRASGIFVVDDDMVALFMRKRDDVIIAFLRRRPVFERL